MSMSGLSYFQKDHAGLPQSQSLSSHPSSSFVGIPGQAADLVRVAYGKDGFEEAAGDAVDDIRYEAAKPPQPEKNWETVKRLCQKHNIELTNEAAQRYCGILDNMWQVDPAVPPTFPIPHRRSCIRLIEGGTKYRIERFYPKGQGPIGRCLSRKMGGVDVAVTAPQAPPPSGVAIITRSTVLKRGQWRPSAFRQPIECGGKAAHDLAPLENAEFLHLIAHSLGGTEQLHNLVLGSSALNTAMMPFESLARTLSSTANTVVYSVHYYQAGRLPQSMLDWTERIDIFISASCRGAEMKWAWSLYAPKDGKLSSECYKQIKEAADAAWDSYCNEWAKPAKAGSSGGTT